MPNQDKTDLLAISLDKRVTAIERQLDTLEKLIRTMGDTPKDVVSLEAKVKALEEKKQDKKDDAAVAAKLHAQLAKQAQDLARQGAEFHKQMAKDALLETRLARLEARP